MLIKKFRRFEKPPSFQEELSKSSRMSSQKLGPPKKIRIVTSLAQLSKWWPYFLKSMGNYSVIGLNCQNIKNTYPFILSKEDVKEMDDDQPFESDKDYGIKGDFDCSEDPNVAQKRLQIRDANMQEATAKRKGRHKKKDCVAVIQLASYGGYVILFRACFFKDLPAVISRFLESSTVIKVGQGLEKDKKWLRDYYGITLCSYVDIREVCCRWPWFASQFDFRTVGIQSVAHWMNIEVITDEPPHVHPHWIAKSLDEDQIIAAAQQVQLYVDVFTVVLTRSLGLEITKLSASLNQIMYYWSAAIFEKPFLNSHSCPIAVKNCRNTACKRDQNEQLLKRIRDESSNNRSLNLASLWTWKLPDKDENLAKMISATPGTYYPSSGVPFVAVNLEKILSKKTLASIGRQKDGTFNSGETSVWLRGEVDEGNGKKKVYKIKLNIKALEDDEGLESSDGGGSPLCLHRGGVSSNEDEESSLQNQESIAERVKSVAEECIPALAFRKQWNQD